MFPASLKGVKDEGHRGRKRRRGSDNPASKAKEWMVFNLEVLTLPLQHPGDILVANTTYAIVTVAEARAQEAQKDTASKRTWYGDAWGCSPLCAEALARTGLLVSHWCITYASRDGKSKLGNTEMLSIGWVADPRCQLAGF